MSLIKWGDHTHDAYYSNNGRTYTVKARQSKDTSLDTVVYNYRSVFTRKFGRHFLKISNSVSEARVVILFMWLVNFRLHRIWLFFTASIPADLRSINHLLRRLRGDVELGYRVRGWFNTRRDERRARDDDTRTLINNIRIRASRVWCQNSITFRFVAKLRCNLSYDKSSTASERAGGKKHQKVFLQTLQRIRKTWRQSSRSTTRAVRK